MTPPEGSEFGNLARWILVKSQTRNMNSEPLDFRRVNRFFHTRIKHSTIPLARDPVRHSFATLWKRKRLVLWVESQQTWIDMGSQPAHSCTLGIPQMTSFFFRIWNDVYTVYTSSFMDSLSMPYLYPCTLVLSCLGAVSSTILAERLQNIQGWKATPELLGAVVADEDRWQVKVALAAGKGLGLQLRVLSGCRCLRIHRDRQNELVLVELVGKQEIWRWFHTTGALTCFSKAFFGSQCTPRRRSSIAQHPQLLEAGFQLPINSYFLLFPWSVADNNRPFTRVFLLAHVTCQGTADLQNGGPYLYPEVTNVTEANCHVTRHV